MARVSLGVADIFRRHAPRVYRYLLGLTGDHLDAEDLLQETFVAAVIGLPRFAGRSSVSTWLLAIARRRYLMFLRRARRRPRTVPAQGGRRTESARAAHAGDVADAVAAEDAVSRLLRDLPERQRTAFQLREYEGLAVVEIAEVLGVAPGTVRVLLFRARQRLRQMVERECCR